MTQMYSLARLGWRPFFQSQVATENDSQPARVTQVHRDRIELVSELGELSIPINKRIAELCLTVGDWVLLGVDDRQINVRLVPFGRFRRRAAGTTGETQSIASNVDTLFIATSANREFNIARLERYLAVAHDAGAFPLVVITKADLCDNIDAFGKVARAISPGILVEVLDARSASDVEVLRPWCEPGQTVALLGSSGVGKSTLINTLSGSDQHTSAARQTDQRGRHTTTSRSMHALSDGGWLIDTPGMRELQLVDVGDAIDDVFSDLAALAGSCRFKDCSHESEPGCAVLAAIQSNELDPDRLGRFQKLQSEDRRNTETLAERRSRDKCLGKMYKSVQREKRGK